MAATSLWAVATGLALWFTVAASDMEQNPDVDDHGGALFMGMFLVMGCGFCAFAWLLPTVMLRRGAPSARSAGVVITVLTALSAALLLLLLSGSTSGWGDVLLPALVMTEGAGVAGALRANRPECVRHFEARRWNV